LFRLFLDGRFWGLNLGGAIHLALQRRGDKFRLKKQGYTFKIVTHLDHDGHDLFTMN